MTQQIKSAEESLAAEEKLFSKLNQELAASFVSVRNPFFLSFIFRID